MSETESDFEHIDGFSECEESGKEGGGEHGVSIVQKREADKAAKSSQGHDDDHEDQAPVVLVELPASLRSGSQKPPPADQESSLGSTASFVRKIGALKIDKGDLDSEGENSSWSHVGGGDDASSIAASSTISGFDLLTISRSTTKQYSCQKCSFLNNANHGVCSCCGFAFSPNPCLDADEQLARNLQQQEENLALKELQFKEKKRKSLAHEAILVRSQVLVEEIGAFVSNCKASGVKTIQEVSHVILASRFMDFADMAIMNGGRVTLAYHFSKNLESRMVQIRQDGLGPNAIISCNLDAAYRNPGHSICLERKPASYSGGMFSISEIEGNGRKGDEDEMDNLLLGWIVATAEEPSSSAANSCFDSPQETRVKVSSGTAAIRTVENPNKTLPLVCFDTSLRNNDIVRRLLNGLLQICNDFFQDSWAAIEDQRAIEDSFVAAASPPNKKARASLEEQLSKALADTSIAKSSPVYRPGTHTGSDDSRNSNRGACLGADRLEEESSEPESVESSIADDEGSSHAHPRAPAAVATIASPSPEDSLTNIECAETEISNFDLQECLDILSNLDQPPSYTK